MNEPQHRVTSTAIREFLADRLLADHLTGDILIDGGAPVLPGRPGAISFVGGTSSTPLEAVDGTSSSLLLVVPAVLDSAPDRAPGMIAVDNPKLEFVRVLREFFTEIRSAAVHPHAHVAPGAVIGKGTDVQAGAYIADDVVVGDGCRIGANAVILERTVIGDHTSIGPNSTIGYVGFGYARESDGSPVLFPHSGGVAIGSHVDIGANTCIDRGTMDDTVIHDHVKIDNLVHVAHNCTVGEGAFVIASSVLCGGVTVGARAWVAPNATVREQRTVGVDAVIGLASTVVKDVPDGVTVVGSPARAVTR